MKTKKNNMEPDYKKLYEEEHKKYEETLSRAKGLIDGMKEENVDATKEDIKNLFPGEELEENENERVRKNCIHFLELQKKHHAATFEIEECITWLTSLKDLALLKKQDEQKSNTPKFEIGDIIKHNRANIICKVISVNGGSYHVENITTGGRITLYNAEQNFHLWTIQDARDGDVLVASDSSIFIFKEVVELGCKYYIALTEDNEAINVNDNLEHCWETSRAVHPATKEQCDLLFSKMKEAGYEWDAKEKELKKIEQKPEIKDDVLSRFAFYQYDDDTIYLSSLFIRESNRGRGYGSKVLKAAEEVAKTFGISKIRLKVENNTWMEEWYKKNGFEYISAEGKYDWLEKQVEPKPTWSEEDEKTLNNILNDLAQDVIPDDEDTQWLKSLKDRMAWRPTEKQMKALGDAIFDADYDHRLTEMNALLSLNKDLKKL